MLKFESGVSPDLVKSICVKRDIYDSIRESQYNFRVLTLNGADDDEDGMRPRKEGGDGHWVEDVTYEDSDEAPVLHNVYQGFKYEQMPSSYVIGDSETFAQSYPEVVVDIGRNFNFDTEYPESEYRLDDNTQKWVREIRRVTMNRQLFPIYTSMEGMTKSHHDLTIEDMKGITFQIVPQFYWKYEWTFNEFMIHRVGKLQTPSTNVKMYDMLGNVWEWVRDDWSDSLSGQNTGEIYNPIKGQYEDNADEKKVIRGGAFDQLVRKVISSAREGLKQDKCKSKFGTQANVGFRPSLVFTQESEAGWVPGQPVDLFFLFDASASQDSEAATMMAQANDVIRSFAGKNGSFESIDCCHVGSALFLGPDIRLMCCQKCQDINVNLWC